MRTHLFPAFALALALLAPSLVAPSASAAERLPSAVEAMKAVFEQRFESGYERNRCGDNVLKLVAAARKKGVDLSDAHVWRISHSGGTELDQVPAMRARGPRGKEMPSRWVFFHAVLELQGYVFDFDFTQQPTVLPVGEYLLEMFIPPNREFFERYRRNIALTSRYRDFESFVKGTKKDLLIEISAASGRGDVQEKISLGELMDRY